MPNSQAPRARIFDISRMNHDDAVEPKIKNTCLGRIQFLLANESFWTGARGSPVEHAAARMLAQRLRRGARRFSYFLLGSRQDAMPEFITSTTQSNPQDATFHFLKEAYYRASRTEESEIVVDLSSVVTITSDDLNELIGFQAKLRQQGRTLVLEHPSDLVLQVFTVTRLDRLFTIRDHKWKQWT